MSFEILYSLYIAHIGKLITTVVDANSKFQFNIRRYSLPSLDRKDLDSAVKAWAKERGCRILGMNKPCKEVGGQCVSFQIAPPGKAAWRRAFADLSLYYVPPTLYATTTNYLPVECSDVFDNLLEPWVLKRGGTVIDEQSLLSEGTLWDYPPDFFKN